jgi:hypothetical protein
MYIKSQSINTSGCFSEMTETIKPEIGKRNEKRGRLIQLRPFFLNYFLIPISYFLISSSIPLSENTHVKLIDRSHLKIKILVQDQGGAEF